VKRWQVIFLTAGVVLFGVGVGPVSAQKIYWSDPLQGEIQRADMDGGNREVLYGSLSLPYFFELDPAGGRIFWAENDNTLVHVSQMDGSGHINTLDIGLTRIRDIGLDFTNDWIYWGDRESHTIHRCRFDGTGSEILFDQDDGLVRPHGMALDIPSGLIYWVDTVGQTVNRGAMDGSGMVEVLYSGLVDPWDIELDRQGGKVYWIDRGGITICRGDMDGNGPLEVLLTSANGLESPQGLGLDVPNGKMYWADSGNDRIRRASLDGSNIEDLVTSGTAYPADLELDLAGHIFSDGFGSGDTSEWSATVP
jgi:sugar lactone lactonase YvrE